MKCRIVDLDAGLLIAVIAEGSKSNGTITIGGVDPRLSDNVSYGAHPSLARLRTCPRASFFVVVAAVTHLTELPLERRRKITEAATSCKS